MRLLFWSRRKKAVGDLEHAVRHALFSLPGFKDFEAPGILVKAFGGEVVVAGIVSTNEARQLALRVVSAVPGVLQVRNKLRTDTELTAALRDALCTSPLTARFPIEPVVRDGVAELRGGASYDAQLAAIKAAQAIDGIRDVANYLQLSPGVASTRRVERRPPTRASEDDGHAGTWPPLDSESRPSVRTRDERLDEALEETFPASDALANTMVTGVRPAPPPDD